MQYPEKFLHFVWKNMLMKSSAILSDGSLCEIIYAGEDDNRDGPDFVAAKIRINSQLIVGNVEIHVCSSDWFKHNHNFDTAYDSVILHVVANFDKTVCDSSGNEIPTLVLDSLLLKDWYKKYMMFNYSSKLSLPCANYFVAANIPKLTNIFCDFAMKRLARKEIEFLKILKSFDNDWFEFSNYLLLRTFGLKINVLGMEWLARQTSAKIIAKESSDLFRLEALLFGQAGMLENIAPINDYSSKLQLEYMFLKSKYAISCVDVNVWKYSPVRPPAMPDLRLAIYAALMNKYGSAFSFMSALGNFATISNDTIITSDYWKSHFTFDGKKFSHKFFSLNSSLLNQIVINAVVPFLFVYGRNSHHENMQSRALFLLKSLPAENNSITRKFCRSNFSFSSALETQGAVELYDISCKNRECLNCSVKNEILNSD